MDSTCNTTLEELRITSERAIVGPLNFHQLALIIAAACLLVAIVMSFYLITMHSLHYTKPREQKHIIRILFMTPIYAGSAFLSLRFYWHAIYFQVISDCYEAFAISSFFALMCHYMAPDLHLQKEYFRRMQPIQPWVWPINWMRVCCGGERGPWRTPQSGLTWFNIVWIGIYHYCFIRVAMTITAVTTQYFGRYCESSNSPVFGHIWVIVINSVAVTIAMFCVIQFYVQLRTPLAEHSPFLKVLAIKLVIFLAFWQTAAISVGTSSAFHIVNPNEILAYPDLKVGIPSLLLCFEMACFSILHLWAFSYRPYLDNAKATFYPVADPASGESPRENEHGPRQGGFLGLAAIVDALNLWDVIKAFGRGMRWLFVGVKRRHSDASYEAKPADLDMDDMSPSKPVLDSAAYVGEAGVLGHRAGMRSTDDLSVATEFHRGKMAVPGLAEASIRGRDPESDGLIAHAQPFSSPTRQARQDRSPYRDDSCGQGPSQEVVRDNFDWVDIGDSRVSPPSRVDQRTSAQVKVGQALWGDRGPL